MRQDKQATLKTSQYIHIMYTYINKTTIYDDRSNNQILQILQSNSGKQQSPIFQVSKKVARRLVMDKPKGKKGGKLSSSEIAAALGDDSSPEPPPGPPPATRSTSTATATPGPSTSTHTSN